MKNRRFLKRLTGLSMVVILTSMSFEVDGIYANNEQNLQSAPVIQEVQLEAKNEVTKDFEYGILSSDKSKPTGFIDMGREIQSVGNVSKGDKNFLALNGATTLPSSYNAADEGYVTSVKNQQSWGTCWAFAACASMEAYAIKHGLASVDDVDFSEYALAYLTYSDDLYVDETGDYTYTYDPNVGFNTGGNDQIAFKPLGKWAGIYNDDGDMYDESVDTGIVAEYEPNEEDIDFVLTGQYYIDSTDREHVKAAIIENGAIACSYFSDDAYAKERDLYNYNYEYSGTNHAVTLVGWDDNLDKNLFTMTDGYGNTYTPNNNGAWLIKNSWGTNWGDEGYCWISYEDMGFNSSYVAVYQVAPKEYYDKIYQHDGATIIYTSAGGYEFGTIYEIEGDVDQTLDAVSFAVISTTNMDYTVSVYLNSDTAILDEGQLLTSQDGTITYEGYYTVELDDVVTLSPGDSISIIISFDDVAYIVQEADEFNLFSTSILYCEPNEHGAYISYGGEFVDESADGDLCIKAMTSYPSDYVEPPRITSIDNSDISKLTIKWREVEGAVSYTLWKGESENDANAELIENLTDNSYVDTDVEIGSTYYYKVCAVLTNETTEYSSVKSVTVDLKAPELTYEMDGKAIELTWEAVEYADGYKIYRAIDGGAYQLVKDVDSTVKTYVESGLEYNVEYSYAVTMYATIDGQYYESGKSNAYTVTRQVPMAEGVYADSRFYNQIVVTWSAAEDIDGYNIYTCIGDEIGWTKYDSVGADATEYRYDTSSLSEGTGCYFAVEPYVMVDGEELVNGYFYYDSTYTKEAPLEVDDVKWYIEDGYLVIKYKTEEACNEYTIWFNEEEYFWDYEDVYAYSDDESLGYWEYYSRYSYSYYDEEGYLTAYLSIDDYEQFPVYITDIYYSKMFQETPFNVSGIYQAPVLNKIEDVILASGVTTTTLTATITNKMENFEYLYQWYVADSSSGVATAIEGATSNTYTATVAADEEKYYYCSVICRHDEEMIVNTTNSDGKRTRVVGSESQIITVSDIANQTYSGSAHTPNVTITKGAKTLVKGTDYTLTYKNNVNAGTATVVITFIGDQAGTQAITKTFTINPRGISDVTVTYTQEHNYTGSAIKPIPTVKNSIGTLVNGTDYTLSYSNNVNIGTATMTLTFKGNYTGTKSVTFTIAKLVPTSITSSKYSVNQSTLNISKITVGTTAGTFLNGINEKQYVVIKKGNTNVASTTALATGMKAYIMDGSTVTKTYTIIVTGDTNGDGKINITDMIAVKANILKKSTLSGVYAKAGDVNGDGKINITDFIKIKATLLKKDSIIGVVAK